MAYRTQLSAKLAAIIVYSRPLLVFSGMICAIAVMWTRDPLVYTLGVCFLFVSMTFDLVDGWFAARFRPHAILAHLADRLMDKLVYSIIFPVIAAGMMWRLVVLSPDPTRQQLLHAIFVLLLCVTVLIRDNFATFMRGFAIRQGVEPEHSEYNRLRTIVAAPVSAILYAHAFHIPEGPESSIYFWISWFGNFPLRGLFLIEILFLVINLGSIAGYCRKYGTACLDELCFGNEVLRRSILSIFPNALTVMNAMMGLLAVFFAGQGRLRESYLILIGAAIFDKLDGALARKLGLTEPLPDAEPQRKINLGNLMDDFADAISFCIVPGWIFHICFTDLAGGRFNAYPIGWIALFYAVMGILRLVYFTLDKHPIPGFFKGFPSPAAAMLVLAPLVIFHQALVENAANTMMWGYAAMATVVFSGLLMNFYPIRYLHMGRYMSRHPWFTRINLILVIVFVFTPYFGYLCLGYMVFYLLSPLFTRHIDPRVAAREHRASDA
ncbi:MAG: CDP-alcohol phosphatidyltransferase family protein [Desulfobacterales bacterium]